MHEKDKYYEKIKNRMVDVELTERVKNYTANRVKLENYYEIGRLIIEAQGGEERAKYGDGLIKEYARRLTIELEKKYNYKELFKIRKFYLFCKKVVTMSRKLNYSHYVELLKFDDINEINYYINLSIKQNLSVRELRKKLKIMNIET